MKVDLEELKRLHALAGAANNAEGLNASFKFAKEWAKCFPAILAKLEAAQRLRDALKLARVPIVSDCTSFSTHRPLLVTMDDALADFDKETE